MPRQSLSAEHGGGVAWSLRHWGAALGPMPTREARMRDRKQCNLARKQLQLEQRAWVNRQVLTPSEARLWSALCGRKLGVQFRRQVPLAGRYIVDFCASTVRLVVEVDGYHAQRRRADARCDAVLGELGYRVIRVEAELVMCDLTAVVAVVRGAL
jgi:very-short-patch-repair endonuclease